MMAYLYLYHIISYLWWDMEQNKTWYYLMGTQWRYRIYAQWWMMGFRWDNPLVLGCTLYLKITIEHGHEQWFLSVLETEWWFLIAMLVYQRVSFNQQLFEDFVYRDYLSGHNHPGMFFQSWPWLCYVRAGARLEE